MKGLNIRERIQKESTKTADWIEFTENRYGTKEERQEVVNLAIKRDQRELLSTMDWLEEILSNGEIYVRDIKKMAVQNGISELFLYAAKISLHIISIDRSKTRFGKRLWFWSLRNNDYYNESEDDDVMDYWCDTETGKMNI